MPEKELSYCQCKPLRRWKSRGVSRLLKDIGAFEEVPKRMRWIRPAVRKSVSLQKVTKLVVDGWFRGSARLEEVPPAPRAPTRPIRPNSMSCDGQERIARAHILPQIAPPGRHGFCKGAENSNQYAAVNELTDVHVTKTAYLSSTLLKHERHSRACHTTIL